MSIRNEMLLMQWSAPEYISFSRNKAQVTSASSENVLSISYAFIARLSISAKHVNVFVVVCFSVSNFAQKNFPNGFAWNFQGSNGLVNKCLNFGGDPRHRLDCFRTGDTENGINRLRCATLQCRACISRHHHSNSDVITSPALAGTVPVLLVLKWFKAEVIHSKSLNMQ